VGVGCSDLFGQEGDAHSDKYGMLLGSSWHRDGHVAPPVQLRVILGGIQRPTTLLNASKVRGHEPHCCKHRV
jgi:hypothetical protein